jgi:hypothetical protein
MGSKLGIGLSIVAPLMIGAWGCSGGEVSAGSEGSAINLGRCFGVECGSSVTSVLVAETAIADCGEAAVTLATPLVLTAAEGSEDSRVRVALDGSMWVLSTSRDSDLDSDHTAVSLAHYSSDGALLGNSGSIYVSGEHTYMQLDLGVDAAGNALVAIYTSEAENADVDPVELLTIHTFDLSLEPVGQPLLFRGMGETHIAGTQAGTFMLAGNAPGGGAHGILARINAGEPEWIQVGVPSSGSRAGVGVSEFALGPNGTSAVLAQRSPRWDGGPDVYQYGISLFAGAGDMLWDLKLPTQFAGGYRAHVAALPSGDFVVLGTLDNETAVVQRVSSDGKFGWAYRVRQWETALAVDPDSGRTVLSAANGLALVDAEGQTCTRLEFPIVEGLLTPSARDMQIADGHLYIASQFGTFRYPLPSP